jgi:hypothetical protein
VEKVRKKSKKVEKKLKNGAGKDTKKTQANEEACKTA